LPCPYNAPYFNNEASPPQFVPCVTDAFGFSYSWTFTPSSTAFRFLTNTYWYVGVGKSEGIAGHACPFNIVASTKPCTPNDTNCIVTHDWTSVPLTATPTTQIVDPPSSNLFSFVLDVPSINVGSVTIEANLSIYNDSYVDIYAAWNQSIAQGYGDIESSHLDFTTLVVPGPHEGLLYVTVKPYNNYVANISTSYQLCTPPNVGPNCIGLLHDSVGDDGTFMLRSGESYDYWVVPTPPVNTSFIFNVTVFSFEEEQTELLLRCDSYPSYGLEHEYEYALSEETPAQLSLVLYPQDFVTGCTWYVGVYTQYGHNFSVAADTISFAVPVIPGASSSSSSGTIGSNGASATGQQNSGTAGSGAGGTNSGQATTTSHPASSPAMKVSFLRHLCLGLLIVLGLLW